MTNIKGIAPMEFNLDFTGNEEILMQIASDLQLEFGYDSDGMDLGECMGILIQHAFAQSPNYPEYVINSYGEFLHCRIEYDLFKWEGISE